MNDPATLYPVCFGEVFTTRADAAKSARGMPHKKAQRRVALPCGDHFHARYEHRSIAAARRTVTKHAHYGVAA